MVQIFVVFNNVVDYELQRSPWEAKLVNNSIKKARKRSKRISEIDTPGINGVHFFIKLKIELCDLNLLVTFNLEVIFENMYLHFEVT